MWKRYVGTGLTAILLAGLASLMTSGWAYADEPVISGDCDATIAAEEGEALTVDAGAVVGREGVLDIGLGSTASGTGDEGDEPVVAVPAADVVEVLEPAADETPAVSDAVVADCETVTKSVNHVGDTARRALSVQALSAGPLAPKPKPKPKPEPKPEPEPEPEPAPVEENQDDAYPPEAVEAQPVLGPVAPQQPASLVLPPLEVPDLSSGKPQPGGPNLEEEKRPAEKNSGRAHALPKSNEQATRVPFVVAVIALAAVAAVMVRRWVSAK